MSQEFKVTVPPDPRYLKGLRAFFGEILGATYGDGVEMLILALDESCSNLLKHRFEEHPVHIRATLQPTLARFEIDDFCCPEDVPQIKPRALEEVRPGGLGTHFVGEIMDRVDFEPDPQNRGRLMLVLEKAFSGGRKP